VQKKKKSDGCVTLPQSQSLAVMITRLCVDSATAHSSLTASVADFLSWVWASACSIHHRWDDGLSDSVVALLP